MPGGSSVEVRDNPDACRYEANVDGALAGFADYIPAQGMLVLSHTEVDDAHEGRGVGSALARSALDDIRAKGLLVMPLCPFIRSWILRHPDYADLQFDAAPSRVSD